MRRGDNNRMPRGKDGQQDPNFILSPQRRSFNSGCYMTGGNNPMGARDGKVMDRFVTLNSVKKKDRQY